LIVAFHGLTGVPMLLNTSLNVNGEPLVETPDDARRFFQTAPADMLVVNDRMLGRPQTERHTRRDDASAEPLHTLTVESSA